ncbi:unnamed protein product, partial [Amoebophrya sp. A120]|eukprot:GSA120T00004742001.1
MAGAAPPFSNFGGSRSPFGPGTPPTTLSDLPPQMNFDMSSAPTAGAAAYGSGQQD